MRKKLFLAGLLLSAACLMACGKKEVKLNMKGDSGSQSPQESESLKKENAGKEWKETITYTDAEGKAVKVNISLKTKVLCDSFDIISATAFDFTPENKERFVKAFFGDAVVYPGDLNALPVDMLQDKINYYTSLRDETTDDYVKEYYEEKIQELEECLETAPELVTPVDNYEYSVYRGYLEGDDKEFGVLFETWNEGMESEFTEISCGYMANLPYYSTEDFYWGDQPCSREEQIEVIKDLFIKAGLNSGSEGLFDTGSANYIGISDDETVEWSDDYVMFNMLGVDLSNDDVYMTPYDAIHYANLFFSGKKIRNATISNPVIFNSVEENVKVMSFDEIKPIISNAFSEGKIEGLEPSATGSVKIDNMCLAYWQVRDGIDIQIKPVWTLMNGAIVFDAITGELIS